ncbi:MAG TPA: hypothetical protein VM925_24440 [Labilithrix sp.]|nr:hypothetical protein [Labilithrix sp.]
MKEPKRLFESGSPVERSILGFAREEAPSDDLARKTLAAMAAVPVARAAQATARPRWMRPRSIVIGLAAVGVAVVVGSVVRPRDPAPPSKVVAPAVPASVEPPVVVEPKGEEKPEVVMTPDSLPNVPPSHASVRSSVPDRPAVASPIASASIAREVELLGDVKAKLGAGEVSSAASALDVYDAEFPQGTLRPEATVLRIRTLLMRGDRAAAEKLGAEFLAKYPSGVHAKRVRALLGERRDEGDPSK